MSLKSLQKELEELKLSVEMMNSTIEKLSSQQSTIAELLNQVQSLKTKTEKQDKIITSLEDRVSDLEQYSRMNDVIISGLKIRPRNFLQAVKGIGAENGLEHEESTEEQVTSFLRKCDIEIDPETIEACHILPVKKQSDTGPATGNTTSTTPPIPAIIMRFANRKYKGALLRQGKKLKGSNVYINEHLTKSNAAIARKARFLRKHKKIESTWTASCKVFIKPNGAAENSRGLLIKNISELDKYD